jgi:hypothetical protein
VHGFNAPVAANALVKDCRRRAVRQAANEIGRLLGGFLLICYFPVYFNKTVQADPIGLLNTLQVVEYFNGSGFYSAAAFLFCYVAADRLDASGVFLSPLYNFC